jgi:hypothetical protein
MSDEPTEDGDSNGEYTRESSPTDPGDPFTELEEIDDIEASADELDDLFDPVETADLDEEAVWEAVLSEDDDELAGTVPDSEEGDAVVPKHEYCKQCEFFSEPPDVSCTNPGTEITELVSLDQFRVENCPVVAQQRRTRTVFPDNG